MPDISVVKPVNGVSETIPSEPGARFVFDFPATDATLSRDGDNLAINFADGSQVCLQDFYTEYDAENLPSFVIDDVEVEAQDFFTAMNEPDLMPAAGPATGADAAANARYHAYDAMSLAQGIDHLWQLDWGMSRAFDHEDEFNSWGRNDDLDGQTPPANTLARADIPTVDTPDRDAPSHELPDLRPETPIDRPVYEPVFRPGPTPPADHNPPYEPVAPIPPMADNNQPYEPVVPPITTPDNPQVPDNPPHNPPVTPPVTPPVDIKPQDPNDPPYNPEDPDTPTGEEPKIPVDPDPENPDPDRPEFVTPLPGVPRSVVEVWERDLRDGNPTREQDGFRITADAGVKDVTIGGIKVVENGKLVEVDGNGPTIPTDEGKIRITGFDPETKELKYEFVLEKATQEHERAGDDKISHTLKVTVTDNNNKTADSYLSVVIKDDVPEAYDDHNTVTYGSDNFATGNVISGERDDMLGDASGEDTHGADGPGKFGQDGEFSTEGAILVKWDVPKDSTYKDEPGSGHYEVETDAGTIKLYDDGKYEFTLKEDIKPDKDGKFPQEVAYDYKIVDADGDVDDATLTIDINYPVKVTPKDPQPDDPETPDKNEDNPNNFVDNDGSSVVKVHDAGLEGGSKEGQSDAPVKTGGLFEIDAKDGIKDIVIKPDGSEKEFTVVTNGKFAETTIKTPEGELHITRLTQDETTGKYNLEYDFELKNPGKHPEGKDGGDITHTFGVKVNDTDSDSDTGTIKVIITDDEPKANADFDYVVEGDKISASGNVIAGSYIIGENADPALGRDKAGADGLVNNPVTWGALTGGSENIYLLSGANDDSARDVYLKEEDGQQGQKVGSLITDKDGNYTFTLEKGYDVPDGGLADISIGYTITDKDKDTASSSLTIKVRGDDLTPPHTPEQPEPNAPEPLAPSKVITVDESQMEGGSKKVETHDGHGITGSQSLEIDLHGQDGTIMIGDKVFTVKDGVAEFDANASITVNGVTLNNFSLEKIEAVEEEGTPKWQIKYDYTLTENREHADPDKSGADDNVNDSIGIVVKDAAGGQAVGSIVVNVHDDRPFIEATGDAAGENGVLVEPEGTACGKLESIFGADKPDVETLTVTINGQEHTVKLGADVDSTEIEGEYGKLVINGNGSYEYKSFGRLDGTHTDEFKVSIVDSDGDKDSVDLKFGVKDDTRTTFKVLTEKSDTVYGDQPDSGVPGDKPVLDGNGDPAHDIIIADIHALGPTPGKNYNLAFIVDNSSSLGDFSDNGWKQDKDYVKDNIAPQLKALFEGLQAQVTEAGENLGQVNILLLGFHTYATSYVSVNLSKPNAIESITNAIDKMSSGVLANHTCSTNYELAFNYATDWFKNVDNSDAINQTFFITDGEPSSHLTSLKSSTFHSLIVTNNGSKPTDYHRGDNISLSSLSGYNPSTGEVILNNFSLGNKAPYDLGNGYNINSNGVMVDKYGNICTVANDNNTNSTFKDARMDAPIVAIQENGQWKLGYASGKYTVDGEKATDVNKDEVLPASEALKEISEVIGIGFKKNGVGNVDNLGQYVDKEKNGISLDDISEAIKGTMVSMDPAGDVLYGNEGMDILFGDRLSDVSGDKAESDTTKVIENLVGKKVSDSDFHQTLIAKHEEIARAIDKDIDHDNKKGGDDTLVGGQDSDLLYGMGGNDVLIGDGGTETANQLKEAVKDISISSSKEALIAAEKALEKLDQNDDVRDGNDILYGGHGNDILYGGGRNDLLNGGTGNDILAGGSGNDILLGGSGNDVLFGGSGDDYLDGGEGIDYILGGSGNDIIVYDKADARIDGGEGIDIIIAGKDAPDLDKLLEGSKEDNSGKQQIVENIEIMLKGSDEKSEEELNNIRNMADVAALGIVVAGNEIVVDAEKWTQLAENNPSGKTVKFESTADTGHKMILEVAREGEHKLFTQTNGSNEVDLLTGNELANIMHGMDGNDQLFGGLGDDQLFGDLGSDFIAGGEGRDWLYGGDGNDIILIDDTDYLVDGGKDDIDIVLAAGQNNPTLSQMLANGDESNSETFASKDIPMVRDVEVMISGNVDGISSMDNLQAKNVNLVQTGDGHKLSLGNGWKKVEKPEADKDDVADKYATETWQYGDGDDALFLETTLAVEEAQKRLRALNRLRRPMAEDGRDNAIPADADKVDSEKTDADKVDSDKTDADNGPKTDDDNQDPAISKDDSQGTVDEESEAAETPPADGGSLADAGNTADKQPGNNRPADDQPDKKDKSDMDDRPANDEPEEDGADDGQKPVESPENRLDEDDAASKPVKDEVESRPSDSWKLDAEKNESRPADRDDAAKADDKDTGQPEDKSLVSKADDKSGADRGRDDSSSRPAENKAGDKEDSSSRPAENKVGSGEAGKTADSHADDFMTGDTGSGMTDSLNDAIQTAQVQINADTGGGL